MSRSKFDLLARLCDRIVFVSGTRRGRLHIDTHEILADLRAAESDPEEYGLLLQDRQIDEINVGDTVEVEQSDPRIGIGLFVLDDAALLRALSRRIKEPARYYLIESRFNSTVSFQAVPAVVSHYRAMLGLVALLKDSAAYLDESRAELIYIHEGRYDVPIVYDATVLTQSVTAEIAQLIASVGQDAHRPQKLAILANVVHGMTRTLKPEARFRHLIERLPELSKGFEDGYRLFASGFSYDKIRSELEAAKIEYTGRIHKVLTDIQNQLLAIPVATVVIATQMKYTVLIDYQFWVNVSVLLGAVVFVILVSLMLVNQFSTLAVLAAEIDRQRTELHTKHHDIAANFTAVFEGLQQRLSTQRRTLRIVGLILMIGLILAAVVFYLVTDPVQHWVRAALNP